MTMKNFVNGEILTESDVDIYLVNTIVAIKSTGESVTSSTTLQNDDELFIPLAANSTYWVNGMLVTDGAAAGDFKSTLTIPSGDIFVHWLGPSLGAAGGTDLQHYLQEASAASQNWGTIAAFDHRPVSFWGMVAIAGTAGNLQLQWAQVASNATATRVLGKSTIWARRIS